MKILITGASGYIGQQLALKLAAEGNCIVALVREPGKGNLLLNHSNITLAKGDLMDSGSLLRAMEGCEAVYHLAALASVWHKDADAFHKFNVGGLERILVCCLKLGIKNVVFTSSAGVAGHSLDSEAVREYTNKNPILETAYEQSKIDAELLIHNYCKQGIRGIIVNPSRVYGPGLLTESNGVTRMIKMYLEGKWHILPGNGKSIGNYVYIDDVVNGHIYAMAKAKPGERYLLGGENATFIEFFGLINQLTKRSFRLFAFPLTLMLFVSRIYLFLAETTGMKPLITPAFVRKYHKNWILSSSKAELELDYKITPLKIGLQKTINWLKDKESNQK